MLSERCTLWILFVYMTVMPSNLVQDGTPRRKRGMSKTPLKRVPGCIHDISVLSRGVTECRQYIMMPRCPGTLSRGYGLKPSLITKELWSSLFRPSMYSKTRPCCT